MPKNFFDRADFRFGYQGKTHLWVNELANPNSPILSGFIEIPTDMLDFALEWQRTPKRPLLKKDGVWVPNLRLGVAYWETPPNPNTKNPSYYNGKVMYYPTHFTNDYLKDLAKSKRWDTHEAWKFYKTM